jgi:SPP1 family predicted phage head-tail adaptor
MAYGLRQVQAGKLDRRIVIQQCTTSLNAMREPVESYATLATVYAEFNAVDVGEGQGADSTQARANSKFTIRYRTDITEKDRIVHDSRTYKILGIREMGRRELLEISAAFIEGAA